MVDAPVQLPLFEEALQTYNAAAGKQPERPTRVMTTSSDPVERLYSPRHFHESEYMDRLGFPGTWPFTRGVHVTGHRGRLWTMRMFAGFGNAEETNARFKYLLANGNAGLSVAYDMPTLYGYDTDDPKAEGEFGTCGVAVSSLADMQVLFDGIPLDEVTTSMTINSPAPMIWAMYLVNAEKRGIPLDRLSGTTDLGQRHARSLPRQRGTVTLVPLSLPDRRRQPVRRAAGEQYRPDSDSGARCRTRRNAIVTHQQYGRSNGASIRESGANRA